MKICTFRRKDGSLPKPGIVLGQEILDLPAFDRWQRRNNGGKHEALPVSLLGIIDGGAVVWERIRLMIDSASNLDLRQADFDPGQPLVHTRDEVEICAPLPHPRGLRDFYAFERHVATAYANRGKPVPAEWYQIPVFYFSNHNAVFGPGDSIPYPRHSRALDYELEVACVIGLQGSNIPPEEAEKHIFGYTIFNDWSARDEQKREMRVGLGPAKGKDFASSFGPWIVTPDELAAYACDRPGVYDLEMRAAVNGREISRGNWNELHFSFGEMIARASQDVRLLPGELIGSGTVGSGCLLEITRGQGPWLKPGDRVSLHIERIGALENTIASREANT